MLSPDSGKQPLAERYSWSFNVSVRKTRYQQDNGDSEQAGEIAIFEYTCSCHERQYPHVYEVEAIADPPQVT